MKKEHINEIQGIVVLALGLILLASLFSFSPEDLSFYTSQPNVPAQNWIRIVGAYVAGILFFILGKSSYFLAAFLFFWSWNKFSSRNVNFNAQKLISSIILFAVISSLFSMTGPQTAILRFQRAGMVGFVCSDFLVKCLGWTGAYIVLFAFASYTNDLYVYCERKNGNLQYIY